MSENELIARRTRNAKIYDIGGGRRRVRIFQHSIHYRDAQNAWRTVQEEIDDSVATPGAYDVLRHGYKLHMDADFPRLRIQHPNGTSELVARLARIDGQPLTGSFTSMREPDFKRVRYEGVAPGVDAIIAFRPGRVRMAIYIKGAAATAREFMFEAQSDNLDDFGYTFDDQHRDNVESLETGRNIRDHHRPLRVLPDPPEPEINNPGTRMRVTRTWTGEVAVRDPVTRIRSWSSDPADVSYPVRIGGI